MTDPEPITLTLLEDGAQSADAVADEIVAFLAPARRSLELALYDLRLPGPVGDRVRATLEEVLARGVDVRLAYNAPGGRHHALEDSPPPRTDAGSIESLTAQTRAIPGDPDLMHHKYVVRDGEAVLTGSTNWTLDSWERQENVVLRVFDVGVATAYRADFDDLWARRTVAGSGADRLYTNGVGHASVRVWFCPAHGPELSKRIGAAIARAHRRVRIASPLLTAAPILRALSVAEGDITGVVDHTQVHQVLGQWRRAPDGPGAWKGPVLERLLHHHGFAGKRSAPWAAAGQPHDVLHAKVVVCDDVAFVGSFNHSRSGEENAENVLEIEDAQLADRLAGWIDALRARYAASPEESKVVA
jgi:phosphatidylserine/phosphatidylglycerophosphate/cardiolipin synthase-like enzyme